MFRVKNTFVNIFVSFIISLFKSCYGNVINHNSPSSTVQNDLKTNGMGAMALAIIIGSIVGSFILVLFMQWLIKRYLCNKRGEDSEAPASSRDNQQQNNAFHQGCIHSSFPEVTISPPSYDNIHLYKQLDLASCTPVYYSVPGLKNYYGILLKKDGPPEEWEMPCDPPAYEEDVDNTLPQSAENPTFTITDEVLDTSQEAT